MFRRLKKWLETRQHRRALREYAQLHASKFEGVDLDKIVKSEMQ